MTLPFENDTSAITKKLAKRNVSANRIFCLFNILTIALAVSLIVGISLFQQGTKISEQKILKQMQQATIGGLTAEQIEVLKKEPVLEDIVPYKHSDSFLMDGIKFEAVYMPSGFGIINSYELVSGTCPEQYNEIVIDKNVQLKLGYQLNIGDTITLPTAGSKTEDFIITGFTDNVETGTFYFYVSPAYAEQGVLLSDIPYSALIRVNGATEMGLVDFENTVYRLASSQDISRNQLYFNSKFCSSLISGSGMGGVFLATLFIAFSSAIVIYSVFYLSVSNQVSQIGQLKTIGMTEKQIKRMIRKEGYRFCLFGIPAGITVGIIFAYLLEPNGITIINAIATSWSYVKKKYKLNVTNFLCSERSLTCYFYCILLDVFKILFLIFIWRQISTMTVNAHGIVKCFDVFKNQFMCMCIIKDFKPVDPFSLQKCMERFYTGVIPWICFL